MSHPEGPRHHPHGEQPPEQAPWGGPPAGGWGEPGPVRRPPGAAWDAPAATSGWAPSRPGPGDPPSWGTPVPGSHDHGPVYPDGAWNPPGPGHPPLPAPRPDQPRGPLVVVGGLVAVVAIVALLGFVAPGFLVTRVLDTTAMDRDVARVLTEDHGVAGLSSVSCAGEVPLVVDARAECTATIEGNPVPVPVRVLTEDGDYEVGPPVVRTGPG